MSSRSIAADLTLFRPALDFAEKALAHADTDIARLAAIRRVDGAITTLAQRLAGHRRSLTLHQRALPKAGACRASRILKDHHHV